jgi:phosphate transport system substrate-binding protein
LLGVVALGAAAPARAATRVNGAGSSYVALAMQQWVADAQTSGLDVNYLPNGSPQGMTSYGQSLIDFAGTEAEFSALQASGGEQNRGFQYVPDVAGATAVLYNVDDAAGRKVEDLHLSMRTIARVFTGDITKWSDPAITADNAGRQLPDQPIEVVYRSGQSGTTGTFYDFVQHTAPDIFNPWAQRNRFPTGDTRIIQLDSSPNFAPKTAAFSSSDQIAQYLAGTNGKWGIGYDEFGYAKVYKASAAWVKNAAGQWVLPYAENISAALESARLRPDLSQELSGVYASTSAKAYPISAYSYLVTQCEPAGDRQTCKGNYPNSGVTDTLTKWMRYIACDGQVNMARIGYAPLPANLSQEVANSIARLKGGSPETLNASNCANPRFGGSLGGGAAAPPDPQAKAQQAASTSSTAARNAAAGVGGSTAGGLQAALGAAGGASVGSAAVDLSASGVGSVVDPSSAAGRLALRTGPLRLRAAAPLGYRGPSIPTPTVLPALALLVVGVAPPLLFGRSRSARRGS